MVQQEDSAHGTPQEGIARPSVRAHGCRRVTLEMRAWLDRADSFKGLPPGTAKPLRFLYAFKDAEPYLGLPAHTYKLVDWLVRLTKPQDWEEGSRPIAWPDARRQAEFLGITPRAVQMLNRTLQEAGIFVMRDDPQGRRYDHRDDRTGRITKAFGSIFKLHCGKLTLKIYTKGERVLRIEAVAHNIQELNCRRSLEYFPELVCRLKAMLERFAML